MRLSIDFLEYDKDGQLIDYQGDFDKKMIELNLNCAAVINDIKNGELNILFVDKEKIQELNRDYRELDKVTDVLAFALNDEAEDDIEEMKLFLGDIVICEQVAAEQATAIGNSLQQEIEFLALHGFLHLVGFEHDTLEQEKKMIDNQKKIVRAIELYRAALEARKKAYIPYSSFAVGAALMTDTEQIFAGCNIENSSYGVTNCAERTALYTAVAQGHKRFISLAVVGDTPGPISPCGICRQALSEFATNSMLVWLFNLEGDVLVITIGDLLPLSFNKSYMKREE